MKGKKSKTAQEWAEVDCGYSDSSLDARNV